MQDAFESATYGSRDVGRRYAAVRQCDDILVYIDTIRGRNRNQAGDQLAM